MPHVEAASTPSPTVVKYCILNLVVGRKILLHIMRDLTGTMVGFEKVGKRRVPFSVQCKYTKCTIQPRLKYYLLVVN
jgi:hypothetical protein